MVDGDTLFGMVCLRLLERDLLETSNSILSSTKWHWTKTSMSATEDNIPIMMDRYADSARGTHIVRLDRSQTWRAFLSMHETIGMLPSWSNVKTPWLHLFTLFPFFLVYTLSLW